MKSLNTIIGTLAVVSATAFSAPSMAATSYRIVVNHAAAVCMGSMPVDQDMLRGRSMALSNMTADSTADVRCGGIATPLSLTAASPASVEVFETALNNASNLSVVVNCMLADGVADGSVTVSTKYPKTITLAAGEVGFIDWIYNVDNDGNNFMYPSMSCQLPTDVGISYTAIIYQEEIGN